jgi:hypothetical protein
MMRFAAVVAVALAVSCGGNSPDMDALCSDQGVPAADGLVANVGCPFEQQTDNILHHGNDLTVAVKDASGAAVASAQMSCGRFLMAKDAHGVAIIIDTRSGEVRSHGSVHAGFAVSSLPEHLSLPLSF